MKLFETIYMKITDENKTYFLQYKSYANKHDGRIDYKEITEDKFLQAKKLGLKIEEKNINNARYGAKERIKRNYFKGEVIDV